MEYKCTYDPYYFINSNLVLGFVYTKFEKVKKSAIKHLYCTAEILFKGCSKAGLVWKRLYRNLFEKLPKSQKSLLKNIRIVIFFLTFSE